ncbi:MAG: hypothetical protein LUD78_11710 [Clostridiales bacterium]|nr:hypothetical protein [Clostridiales bacterium]
MATKKRSAGGAAVSFVLCSILSVAAGIAAVVLLFQKWVVADLLGGESYSILEFRQMVNELQETLESVQTNLAGLGLDIQLELEGFTRFDQATLLLLAAVVVLIAVQAIYVLLVLTGRPASRAFGIFAGLLTLLLGAAVIVLFFWMTSQLNETLTLANEALSTASSAANDLLGTLSAYFPSLQGTTVSTLTLDVNEMLHLTTFPFLVTGLGLVEAILAR